MYKIGIIGPESTGKSTLARYLVKRYKGFLVPEYARTFVEQKGTTDVTWDELCTISRHQIEEIKSLSAKRSNGPEDNLCSNNEAVYFFDTELVVTKVWFEYAFGEVPEWLNVAIMQYPMDIYLLLYPDLPWVPDVARSNGSDAMRLELFHRYETEIQSLNIPYYIIRHT